MTNGSDVGLQAFDTNPDVEKEARRSPRAKCASILAGNVEVGEVVMRPLALQARSLNSSIIRTRSKDIRIVCISLRTAEPIPR